jgi:class 3 adenylate cyclase
VLFLLTLAYLDRARRPRWWWAPVLLCGAVGTVNVLLGALTVPSDVLRRSLEAFRRGAPVSTLPLVAYAPWYVPLQLAHTVQLYGFILLSALLFVRDTYRPGSLVEASDARLLALIYTVAAVALTVTELVPLLGLGNAAPRLAPLLSLPFLVVVRGLMRRRVIEIRSLRTDRDAILPYLPVPRFADLLRTLGGPVPPSVEAAVIFSDIRSFTTITEVLDPAVVVAWLDAFFSRMSREIIAEDGVVDKLMGDGILAVFGAPVASERPGDAAFRAALRMQRALADLNRLCPIQANVALRMGIGIHYGRLVVGSLGGSLRKTYTVIGDTVNTAQRIEARTKSTGFPVLISRAVFDHLHEPVRDALVPLGPIELTGKQNRIELFGLPEESLASGGFPWSAWSPRA